MASKKLLAAAIGLSALSSTTMTQAGSLQNNLLGDSLTGTGIQVHGWLQAGLIANDNGTNDVSKQAFLNSEEGLNLNQLALVVEKPVKSNVVSRATPTPAPMREEMDWGFKVTSIYGNDAQFFKTYGWDDDLHINDLSKGNESAFTVAQAYLEFYLPVLGGSNLMVGLFHTPLENEIGFALPSPAPTEFYTRAYSFVHGPAKHAGLLYSAKLPSAPGESIWGFELGVVQGWNNLQDENNDVDVIANLRWRSPDMSTWVDWENIYGNGANDSFAGCACGSPYPTVGDDADRYQTYLTVSKVLDPNNRVALEMSYGKQEAAALNGGADAQWYGANLNWYHKLAEDKTWNTRLEWFNADDPANLVMTGAAAGMAPSQWSTGDFYALTTNLSWFPSKALRIRPELRYDVQNSDGPDAYANGTKDSQLVASVDMTLYF